MVLSPLLALIALVIRLDSPGPVVFQQKRFGTDRKLFEIYKFRTMRVDAPRDVPTNDLRGSKAVSYTHLDVYKRQDLQTPITDNGYNY